MKTLFNASLCLTLLNPLPPHYNATYEQQQLNSEFFERKKKYHNENLHYLSFISLKNWAKTPTPTHTYTSDWHKIKVDNFRFINRLKWWLMRCPIETDQLSLASKFTPSVEWRQSAMNRILWMLCCIRERGKVTIFTGHIRWNHNKNKLNWNSIQGIQPTDKNKINKIVCLPHTDTWCLPVCRIVRFLNADTI